MKKLLAILTLGLLTACGTVHNRDTSKDTILEPRGTNTPAPGFWECLFRGKYAGAILIEIIEEHNRGGGVEVLAAGAISGMSVGHVNPTKLGGGRTVVANNANISVDTNAPATINSMGQAGGSVLSQTIGAIKGVQPVNPTPVVK
jgi:hypothetical protein